MICFLQGTHCLGLHSLKIKIEQVLIVLSNLPATCALKLLSSRVKLMDRYVAVLLSRLVILSRSHSVYDHHRDRMSLVMCVLFDFDELC